MTNSVDLLMERLKANDASAAELVFQRFSGQLIALVQKKLGWKLRRKIDPEDVMQSALNSFFQLQAKGELKFENWNALWGLLQLLAMRKCGRQIEYYQAACRNVFDEQSAVFRGIDLDASRAEWEAVAQDPSPSHVAMMKDQVEVLLNRLDERDRRIVTLKLQGYSIEEISQDIGRAERTVQRVLKRITEEVMQLCQSST